MIVIAEGGPMKMLIEIENWRAEDPLKVYWKQFGAKYQALHKKLRIDFSSHFLNTSHIPFPTKSQHRN